MHEGRQRATPIRHICRRHGNRMRQTLRINYNVALDTRNLFTCVVSFVFRTVCILDTLRINDTKRRLLVAPKAGAGRANLIFLMPAPAGSIHLPTALHSIYENTNTPRPISENRSVAFATDTRFSARTTPHKIFRISRFFLAWSSSALFPVFLGSFQTVRGLHRLGILFSSNHFTILFGIWQKDRKQVLRSL